MGKEIKKYRCIKDLVMTTGDKGFIKGRIYECIGDNFDSECCSQGHNHYMPNHEEYLEEIKEGRDLNIPAIVRYLQKLVATGLLRDDTYCMINCSKEDAIHFTQDFTSVVKMPHVEKVLHDFMFMGHQMYLMPSEAIESGKWVITVGTEIDV